MPRADPERPSRCLRQGPRRTGHRLRSVPAFPGGVRRPAASGDRGRPLALRLGASPGVRVLPIDGAWWHDVDTPEDLRAARVDLRHSLIKEGDGPVSRYL